MLLCLGRAVGCLPYLDDFPKYFQVGESNWFSEAFQMGRLELLDPYTYIRSGVSSGSTPRLCKQGLSKPKRANGEPILVPKQVSKYNNPPPQ